MPVTGVPAFNAIAILEVEAIKFADRDVRLVAKAAYVNTNNGKTYGSTTCSQWSKNTLERLAELRAAMEQDMAEVFFEQPQVTQQRAAVEPGGLAESLAPEAPSV